MAGESDVIKRDHTDQLASAIRDSREDIILGGTHFVQTDRPDVVNADILRFLGADEKHGFQSASDPACGGANFSCAGGWTRPAITMNGISLGVPPNPP